MIGEGSGFFRLLHLRRWLHFNQQSRGRTRGADHDRCRCDSQDV